MGFASRVSRSVGFLPPIVGTMELYHKVECGATANPHLKPETQKCNI